MSNQTNLILIASIILLVTGVYLTVDQGMKIANPNPNEVSSNLRSNEGSQVRKKWEASPDGIQFKKWETSAAGQRIKASQANIKVELGTSAQMAALVTSVNFQRAGSNGGGPKWLIVNIKGQVYMMQFLPKTFEQFKYLQVGDNISVKASNASYSPNHPFLIIEADQISFKNQTLYQRERNKDNHC